MEDLSARIWALDWRDFKSAACLPIALAIARRSYESGMCWAKHTTIGDMCGVSKQTVARCLQELEDKGLLARVEHFRDDGSRSSDTMWLTLPEVTWERTSVDHSELERRRAGAGKKRTTTKTPPTTVMRGTGHGEGDAPPIESSQNGNSNGLKGNQDAQEREGEEEDSPAGEDIPAAVDMIWKAGSDTARQRSSRGDIETGLRAALKRGHGLESIMRGYGAYLQTPDAVKDGGAFQRGAHVILAKDRWQGFLEEAPHTPPVGGSAAQAPAQVDDNALWLVRVQLYVQTGRWPVDAGPPPDTEGTLVPMVVLEQLAKTHPEMVRTAIGLPPVDETTPLTPPADDMAGAFD